MLLNCYWIVGVESWSWIEEKVEKRGRGGKDDCMTKNQNSIIREAKKEGGTR